MDNPDLIEKYEAEFQSLLTRMHNDGIGYDAIHFVVKQALDKLELQGYAENLVNQSSTR